ncbi:MAG: uroporphyrinogen-III synthase [Rhodospirillaceae bacterium]|nr:MAG: uroporphyrinogen-III synthase [Rhodospirillaceae bacterium]
MTTTRAPSTIVVTRPEGEDGPLTRALRKAGQNVLHWQVASVVAASDPAPLRVALRNLDDYDWIVFSSAAAVDAVLRERTTPPSHARVAAVGTATAGRLRRAEWPVDLVPAQAGAEHLATALLAQRHSAQRVLFPASADALPTLSRQLRQAGLEVDQVEAYRLTDVTGPVETWRGLLAKGAVDAVTFASPSAVDRLHDALKNESFTKINGLVVAAIGATTAEALERNGLTVTTVARPSSLDALAAVTVAALAARNSTPPASRKA